jgi:hypothetical protein
MGVGGKEFLPALAFPPPPNFVFCFAKCAANTVALDPPCPFARNIKELPFCLPKFNVFDIIILNKLIYTHYK